MASLSFADRIRVFIFIPNILEPPTVSYGSLSIAYLVQIVHNHICCCLTSTELRVGLPEPVFALTPHFHAPFTYWCVAPGPVARVLP